MNALTRRRFLLASGAAAVAATAAGVGWKDLADRTRSDPLPVGTGVLVLVTLYGGNDGLNTVVPAADPAYQRRRPDLAYAQGEVLDLGDGLGLNPGLAGLKQQWDDGTLGDRPRRRLPEARPQPLPVDGHLADRLARPPRGHRVDRPLAGRQRRRPAARRVAGAGAAADAGGRDHRGRRAAARAGSPCPTGRSATAFTALGQAVRGRVAAAGLRGALDRPTCTARSTPFGEGRATRTAKTDRASRARSPRSSTSSARCVEAGVPTRVYSVSLGGFDTHADERGTQQRLLTELDQAVSGFLTRHGGHRARPRRGRDGLLGVRPAGGRQRQRGHRPRHRRARCSSRARRCGAGSSASSPASPTSTTATSRPPRTSATSTPPCCPTCSDADPAPVLGPGRTTLPLLAGA